MTENYKEIFRILSSGDDNFPWNHFSIAKEFIKENTVFLNLSGDFAEKLLDKKYPPQKISVINGIDTPWFDALVTSGMQVYDNLSDCKDESFTLITNRFSRDDLSLIKSKLKKGGHYISEEIGFETYKSFFDALNIKAEFDSEINLENVAQNLKSNGFKLVFRNQKYVKRTLKKDEAIIFLNALKGYFPILSNVSYDIIKDGVTFIDHRFIYTAKKLTN